MHYNNTTKTTNLTFTIMKEILFGVIKNTETRLNELQNERNAFESGAKTFVLNRYGYAIDFKFSSPLQVLMCTRQTKKTKEAKAQKDIVKYIQFLDGEIEKTAKKLHIYKNIEIELNEIENI